MIQEQHFKKNNHLASLHKLIIINMKILCHLAQLQIKISNNIIIKNFREVQIIILVQNILEIQELKMLQDNNSMNLICMYKMNQVMNIFQLIDNHQNNIHNNLETTIHHLRNNHHGWQSQQLLYHHQQIMILIKCSNKTQAALFHMLTVKYQNELKLNFLLDQTST